MRYIFFLFCLISFNGFAQPWKSFIISVKGDTLNRVDMEGKKQGPWFIHVDDLRGERGYEEEGYFENDLKEGTWKRYSLQGIKIAEENYRWGKLNGRSRYFTYNGGLQREESWRAMDPVRKYDTIPIYDLYDPSKLVDQVVVKNEGVSMKHGEWNYYDPVEGVIVETQKFQLNKLVTDNGELIPAEDVKPIGLSRNKTDTAGRNQKPQAILDYEKKNSGKKKIKSRDGATYQ